MVSDYLAHYGVKGQKHGERKYQNKDGSLTALGRVHYGVGATRSAVGKVGKAIRKKVRPTNVELNAQIRKEKSKILNKQKREELKRLKKTGKIDDGKKGPHKKFSELSDAEIDDRIKRLKKEAELAQLESTKNFGPGKRMVMEAVSKGITIGLQTGIQKGLGSVGETFVKRMFGTDEDFNTKMEEKAKAKAEAAEAAEAERKEKSEQKKKARKETVDKLKDVAAVGADRARRKVADVKNRASVAESAYRRHEDAIRMDRLKKKWKAEDERNARKRAAEDARFARRAAKRAKKAAKRDAKYGTTTAIVLRHSDYIAHYGTKGQKWGIRKYQNSDGTLTEAGMKRYKRNARNAAKANLLASKRESSAARYKARSYEYKAKSNAMENRYFKTARSQMLAARYAERASRLEYRSACETAEAKRMQYRAKRWCDENVKLTEGLRRQPGE